MSISGERSQWRSFTIFLILRGLPKNLKSCYWWVWSLPNAGLTLLILHYIWGRENRHQVNGKCRVNKQPMEDSGHQSAGTTALPAGEKDCPGGPPSSCGLDCQTALSVCWSYCAVARGPTVMLPASGYGGEVPLHVWVPFSSGVFLSFPMPLTPKHRPKAWLATLCLTTTLKEF